MHSNWRYEIRELLVNLSFYYWQLIDYLKWLYHPDLLNRPLALWTMVLHWCKHILEVMVQSLLLLVFCPSTAQYVIQLIRASLLASPSTTPGSTGPPENRWTPPLKRLKQRIREYWQMFIITKSLLMDFIPMCIDLFPFSLCFLT